MPRMFKTKYEAREAGYSVRQSPKGWSIFCCDLETGTHNSSECGAWAIIMGTPIADPKSTSKASCSSKGCNRPAQCRGMCLPHYHCMYRSEILAAKNQSQGAISTACSFDGCKHPVRCRGMCLPHYHYMYRSGTLVAKKQWRPDIDGVDVSKPGCIAVCCENDRYKRGFCNHHRAVVRHCGREDLLLPMMRRQTPISEANTNKVINSDHQTQPPQTRV